MDTVPDEVVQDIFEFFARIPPFYEESIRPELQISGAWHREVLEPERPQQLALIQSGDKVGYRALLQDLFFNELVSGLSLYHRFGKQSFAHPDFASDLDLFELITGRDRSSLAHEDRWRRWGVRLGKGIVSYADPVYGIQANAVLILVEAVGTGSPVVMDLGSGYGGLAERLVLWSPRPLDIVLVDIPLNLTTAYAYLAGVLGRKRVELVSSIARAETRLLERDGLEESRVTMIPSSFLGDLERLKVDVLHNAHSFSEMDEATVSFYLATLVNAGVQYIVETNTNKPGSTNWGGHQEVLSGFIQSELEDSHLLLGRFSESGRTRYVTSVYLSRSLLARQ